MARRSPRTKNLQKFLHSARLGGGGRYGPSRGYLRRGALGQDTAEPIVSEAVLLQSRLDTGTLGLPVGEAFCVVRRKVHELFEDASKDRKAVHLRVLASTKEPLLPLGVVSYVRRATWRTRREKQPVQRPVRAHARDYLADYCAQGS